MTGEQIKAELKARGLRQVDLANAIGMEPNYLTKALGGGRKFSADEERKIAAFMGHPPAALPGAVPVGEIPVIGQVVAGSWREAVQDTRTFMPSPDPTIPGGTFALVVSGDSMDEYVPDGGTVIVDPNDKALFPGRFYVVINDEGETTFKRFFADPARLSPCSSNPQHREIVIGSDERFAIVGRVLWRAARM